MTPSDIHKVRIFQTLGRVTMRGLEACDQLLLILPAKPTAAIFNALPQGAKMQALMRKQVRDSTPAFTTRLDNKRQTLIVAGTLSASSSAFDQLTLGRQLVAAACCQKPGSLGIVVVGFDKQPLDAVYNNLLAAALAAACPLPSFKKIAAKPAINSIRILGRTSALDTARTEAEAIGNNLARSLTTLPPNKMDAKQYANFAKALAKQRGWSYKRFDTKALTALNAGAFLAVAQGNENDTASIVRLRYRPGKKSAKADLSLVGKGIIFDTGGTNLKPFQSMLDMHGDMQGSAVALGTLLAIAELKLPIAVDCWLALTENRTGPTAYKSQDVVTAANGKTIQTVHTDAEGRMALADTLVLACREKPAIIFDFATLTGACVNAVTSKYSGVFTNQARLHPQLKRTGQSCGERVWPFPIGAEFLDVLESDTADLLQCSIKGEGDHIIAASFLAEFVDDDIPWVHMDLSASDVSGGLAHVASKFTGFGVRYTMSVVLDQNLFKAAK